METFCSAFLFWCNLPIYLSIYAHNKIVSVCVCACNCVLLRENSTTQSYQISYEDSKTLECVYLRLRCLNFLLVFIYFFNFLTIFFLIFVQAIILFHCNIWKNVLIFYKFFFVGKVSFSFRFLEHETR